MEPIKESLVVEQGADFELQLTITDGEGQPISLVGAQMRGQVRKSFTSQRIFTSFVCSVVGDPDDGVMVAKIPAAQSSDLDIGDGTDSYVFDVEVQLSTGAVIRASMGDLTFSPECTR